MGNNPEWFGMKKYRPVSPYMVQFLTGGYMVNSLQIPGFNNLVDSDLVVDISDIKGNIVILSLKGLVDTYNTPFLTKKVNLIIGNGYEKIVFNMRGVSYMSSTGIGAFTSLLRQLRSVQGDFVLASVPAKVKDVFDLIGFSSFIKFSPDVDSAVRMISSSPVKAVRSPFPKVFKCTCSKKLQASKAGQFRCPQCKIVISVSEQGSVKKLI